MAAWQAAYLPLPTGDGLAYLMRRRCPCTPALGPCCVPLWPCCDPLWSCCNAALCPPPQVESSASRALLRTIGTVVGGALGYATMLNGSLANNPYFVTGMLVLITVVHGLVAPVRELRCAQGRGEGGGGWASGWGGRALLCVPRWAMGGSWGMALT